MQIYMAGYHHLTLLNILDSKSENICSLFVSFVIFEHHENTAGFAEMDFDYLCKIISTYGKDAMGFGDVKLMAALGLFFGLSNIIVITLVSFLIGAVLSIILLISKIRKSNEYIPFGPFIVIATFVSMYVPFEQIKNVLLQIFTLGMYNLK